MPSVEAPQPLAVAQPSLFDSTSLTFALDETVSSLGCVPVWHKIPCSCGSPSGTAWPTWDLSHSPSEEPMTASHKVSEAVACSLENVEEEV